MTSNTTACECESFSTLRKLKKLFFNSLLDGSFGTGGKITTAIGSNSDKAYAVSLQTDGKIVVAGHSDDGDYDFFSLARYNNDGSLDGTFGTGGKVTTAFGSGSSDAYAASLQTDGKIIAAGSSYDGYQYVFTLARYDSDGSLDGTFGNSGKVTTAIRSKDDEAYAVSVQTDGKIVAAGNSSDGNRNDFAVVRYLVYPVGIGVHPPSDVCDVSANLQGAVNAMGVSTTVRFLYGTSSGIYSDSVNAVPGTVSDDTGMSVAAGVAGLSGDTKYYCALATTSSEGYYRGDEEEFKTLQPTAGTALMFNGDGDYVVVRDNTRLQLTTAYTIEAWIKPRSFPWLAGIVSKYQNPGANGFALRLSGEAEEGINFDEMETSDRILEADHWYHIAAVNNSGARTLYVNGVNVPLSGTPLTVQANDNDLTIGTDYLNNGGGRTLYVNGANVPLSGTPLTVEANDNDLTESRDFDGTIEEVRIWNVARDSTEIRNDMHRVFTTIPEGLVGYWPLNDSTGTTAQDCASGFEGRLNSFDFNSWDGWRSSTIPAGKGTSIDSTNFTNGTASLGTVSLATTDAFDAPMQLVGTQIDCSPNSLPNSSPTMLSDRYWVVNAFGTPGTFSTNLTFTVPSGFTSNGSASASSFTLYKRSSASDGDWTMLIHGASGVTSTTVTFDGITSFSQFSLGQGGLLPIQLASFTATTLTTGVQLEWTTLSEVNSMGFFVERRPIDAGAYTTVSDLIPGAGTSVQELHYQWMDTTVTDGNYNYRLKLVDLNGASTYSNAITVAVSGVLGVKDRKALPKEFALQQNYPNPFNPTTNFQYSIASAGGGSQLTILKVYDILGREVATLVNEVKQPGEYSVTWDASNEPSGVYICRLSAGSFTEVRKLLLLK